MTTEPIVATTPSPVPRIGSTPEVDPATRLFSRSILISAIRCTLTYVVFPWILPILITAAFAQYVIDSYWVHRHTRLRGSKLGRYNGMLYFVPPCMDILIRMGVLFLQPLLILLVWLLVLSTLISMGQRLMLKSLSEQLPSCPPEK